MFYSTSNLLKIVWNFIIEFWTLKNDQLTDNEQNVKVVMNFSSVL